MSDGQLLTLILTFIVAGGGAYLGSYLREKGKSLATKEDIGNITAIVEQVKIEIARQDWAQREWSNLRRTKLEELLTAVHGIGRFVNAEEESAPELNYPSVPDPRPELDSLQALYFPELKDSVNSFRTLASHRLVNSHTLRSALRRAGNDVEASQQAFTEFSEARNLQAYYLSEHVIRMEARELLLQIVAVPADLANVARNAADA